MNDELLERMAEALTEYGIANASGDGYRFNAYGLREGLLAALAVVEPLLKDAERYRWLRDNSLDQPCTPCVIEPGINGYPITGLQLDEIVDAFIDAAAKERA